MASDLKGKVETEFEIKAPPQKFYQMFRKTAHHLPNAAGDHVQGVDVHEGDWESHGSVKVWKYTVDGKQEWFKEKVEFDDENNMVSMVGLEGDVFQHYRSFKPVYHVVPKGEGSLAKLSIEFERLDANVPPPNKYLNVMVNVTKDMDAHLQKA
ncbi:Major latex protein domain containing protein [Parasponia andersonii]|uniref:Major latex protein domain containing protein n=1 Tax=Parasponia andersonii TaxID=3476 RepID=A0A2P5BIK9_PARAD|nr:Major latex protein domain containing protein [Parasponia andersonii]